MRRYEIDTRAGARRILFIQREARRREFFGQNLRQEGEPAMSTKFAPKVIETQEENDAAVAIVAGLMAKGEDNLKPEEVRCSGF